MLMLGMDWRPEEKSSSDRVHTFIQRMKMKALESIHLVIATPTMGGDIRNWASCSSKPIAS